MMADEGILDEEQRAVIERAAQADRYREKPVPDSVASQLSPDFASFVSIPWRQRSLLAAVYDGAADVDALVQADWETALACGALYLFDDSTVTFALHVPLASGVALEASIRVNRQEGKPWFLTYVPDVSRMRLLRDVAAEPGSMPQCAPDSPAASVPSPDFDSGFAIGSNLEQASAPEPAPEPSSGAPFALPPLAEQAFLAMRSTSDYLNNPVPAPLRDELAAIGRFSDSVDMNRRSCERIAECSGGAVPDDEAAVFALLDRDWPFALEHGVMRYFEDADGGGQKVLFPVSVMREDGETPIEVGFWRNRNCDAACDGVQARPWYLYFVYFALKRPSSGEALFNWAYLGPLDKFLEDLANKALDERWSFRTDDAGDASGHEILRSYITYTFYRLQRQKPCGVLEDEQEGIAAFNTGLVDSTYEPLYAVFTKNDREGRQPWYFQAFCRAGASTDSGWGTRLSSTFNPLPPRAKYFSRKEDLLFDTERELDINYDHILLDNMNRLPRAFMRQMVIMAAAVAMPERLEAAYRAQDDAAQARGTEEYEAKRQTCKERFAELRELVEEDTNLHLFLNFRLKTAIELARRRAEWNFRTAVPCYYPAADKMSLLLPLDLTNDQKPDVALVVELAKSGRYIAKTILTMPMAYNDARLLCRPESDWLNTSVAAGDLAAFEGDFEEEPEEE